MENKLSNHTCRVQCVSTLANKFIISYVVFASFAILRLHVSFAKDFIDVGRYDEIALEIVGIHIYNQCLMS